MVVVLGTDLMIEAKRIIIDEDRDAALAFLREHVAPVLERHESGHCRPVFEWGAGGAEPDALKRLKEGPPRS